MVTLTLKKRATDNLNVFPEITPTSGDIPPDTTSVGDIYALRKRILQKVKDAVASAPPLTYGNYELRIENVEYDDEDEVPISQQKQAIFAGKTIGKRLRGDVILRDLTTKRDLSRRRLTLANVPYLTEHGSFIFNGNAYAIPNQQRLRAGVYVRVQDNGIVSAFVNTIGGKSHDYEFDPESGVFYMNIRQVRVPLISVLRAAGIKDDAIRAAWGDQLYKANAAKAKSGDVNRIFPHVQAAQIPAQLQAFLQSVTLEPSVMNLTLGKPFKYLEPEAILLASKKMLSVYRGETDPDERDALYFQKVVTPAELFAEAITNAHNGLKKYILRAIRRDKTGDLMVIPTGYYDTGINSFLLGSGVSELLEDINPGESLDRLHRIIKTGEGGIEEVRAIPIDARALHPSQLGFIDAAVTGKLLKTGVDNRLAWMTRIGNDGKLYALFKDVRSGKYVWRSPNDLVNAVIAFPGELESNKEYVIATKYGKSRFFHRKDVDYALPFGEQYFSYVTNFVPGAGATHSNRVYMGQNMHLQALPLLEKEEPLVQVKLPTEQTSFQRAAAKYYGAVFSDLDGVVKSVNNNEITIMSNTGRGSKTYYLYNNFPFNRKTFIHNTPVVKPGDTIKKGQLLAYSNFTTPEGNPAFGINAYSAILPYRGYNYEDAFVISQSFANRLKSELMYQDILELDETIITGKDKYKSIFPGKYTEEFYKKYDDDGILLPGQTVKKGEPLILAVKEADISRLAGRRRYYVDGSVLWNHPEPGTAVDTYKTKNYYYINAKTTLGMQVGDKLVGRYGDKGVIAKIIPDEEMPRDSRGRIFDLLINPLVLVSRVNQGQIYELLLAKIAKEKTGKPYFISQFMDDFYQFVDSELKKHGVPWNDTVYDPVTGAAIPNVLTGYKYVLKLHHMAEDKLHARAFGTYSSEEIPIHGGEEGAKRIGIMELLGLLGHNAYRVIQDAKYIRGQENQAYWFDFMRAGTPTYKEKPFVQDKFENMLKGMGINIYSDNKGIHLFALTDKDITELTRNRFIKNGETIRLTKDDFKIIPGGLYDQQATGGMLGSFWSAIRLAEPMPSPVMEDVIRSVLDLTEEDFLNVLAGKATIPGTELTGPTGIQKALADINVDKLVKETIAQIKTAKDTTRSKLVRKLRYLLNLKNSKAALPDLIWTRVPVLPPIFRPISLSGDVIIVPDINALYQEVIEANDLLTENIKYSTDVSEERLALYRAIKAVTGLGDPIQVKHRRQDIKGLLRQIRGASVKTNYINRKLLTFLPDMTGRAVITPNPALDIDHMGIPVDQAWTLFKPFIIRNLVKQGMALPEAIRQYQERTPQAGSVLQREMESRVVLINRAPTLHRYGIMAFKPVLTRNHTIEFNPQITHVFGADFDGDAVQIHVPVSDEAQAEAKAKMLPSKNLFSSAKFTINYPPIREYVLGLWLLTRGRDNVPPKRFKTIGDLLKAYKRNEIDYSTPVIIEQEF